MSVPDFWNLHARAQANLSPEWEWFRLEVVEIERRITRVTGAICREVFKSGPRKGQKNWGKRERPTEREVILLGADHDAFIAEWEKANGCSRCGGSGREFAGWSSAEGERTRPCSRGCLGATP